MCAPVIRENSRKPIHGFGGVRPECAPRITALNLHGRTLYMTANIHDLALDVHLTRADEDEYDVLRNITASISSRTADEVDVEHEVGTVEGWVSRSVEPDLLWESTDAADAEAHELAAVAREILRDDHGFCDVLLINRITLGKRNRGQKLMGRIIDELMFVLQLAEDDTLVALWPEPLTEDGRRRPDGPERDAGMAKLHDACEVAGFEPWGDGQVWWRPGI